MCRTKGINIAVGNEITLPNCTNSSWTTDNTTAKNIRLALIKEKLISHDLWYLQDKFGFTDEDMQSVPQAPFKYLGTLSKTQHLGHHNTKCYTN